MLHSARHGSPVPFVVPLAASLAVWLAPPASGASTAAALQDPSGGMTVDEALRRLHEEYGDKEKRYEALADKVDKAIAEALSDGTWSSGPGEGQARPLAQHPHAVRVAELAAVARAAAQGRKSTPRVQALLERFPWNRELELVQGLAYGSDRPVPPNTNGFVKLEELPEPLGGFPDLSVNHCLYGLGEIVGWRFAVKPGKRLKYDGREADDPPALEDELPAWERLRVALHGVLPDTALLAVPQLTHAIHSRLAERRRGEGSEPAPPDLLLALFDTRWNGFVFTPPWSKEALGVVAPVHELFTERDGFLHRFPLSQRLVTTGDMPFISVLTHQAYADAILGERIDVGEIIASTAGASAAHSRFEEDGAWLGRYRALVDLVVRAVLLPETRYPRYLAVYDWPDGRIPEGRAVDHALDVPRRHALLLWAWADGDPVRVADFLHDAVIEREGVRFPSRSSLPLELLTVMREREAGMLAELAERVAAGGGDLERELSPHPTYRRAEGSPSADALRDSYARFHAPLAAAVREAAWGALRGEIE